MRTNLRGDTHAHQARRFNPDIWRHLWSTHSLSCFAAQTQGPGKDGVVASEVWQDDEDSKPVPDRIWVIEFVRNLMTDGLTTQSS